MQRVWRTVTGFYYVCARGTDKQFIFEGDEDRWEFLELMRECCREEGVTVVAWCLMNDHVDLVLSDHVILHALALLVETWRRFDGDVGAFDIIVFQ